MAGVTLAFGSAGCYGCGLGSAARASTGPTPRRTWPPWRRPSPARRCRVTTAAGGSLPCAPGQRYRLRRLSTAPTARTARPL